MKMPRLTLCYWLFQSQPGLIYVSRGQDTFTFYEFNLSLQIHLNLPNTVDCLALFPRLASGWRRGKAARQPWSLGLLFWLQPFAESGKALVLKTLSQFLARDLYINVLLLTHILGYTTNQLVGQKEYRVDSALFLVAICTCRGLLKTAKTLR